jgi:acetyl esterase/lipase
VLTYGPGEREYVRVFPASDAAAPIVALVHGGAYVRGHPDDRCFPAPAFNAAGCTFASIGYPARTRRVARSDGGRRRLRRAHARGARR